MKPKLLIQACCGPCAVVPLLRLSNDYDITLYFYGGNIQPEEEYNRRLEALIKVNDKLNGGKKTAIIPYIDKEFLAAIKGLEQEPEGGKRCEQCISLRLSAAAKYAAENGFDEFTSSLSTSPHKNPELIDKIGFELELKHGIKYLPTDFKKDGGFQKSAAVSKELGIYRQNYCGCRFSYYHVGIIKPNN